jgi:hypothetical protein
MPVADVRLRRGHLRNATNGPTCIAVGQVKLVTIEIEGDIIEKSQF